VSFPVDSKCVPIWLKHSSARVDKLNQQIEKINVNLEQASQAGDSNKLIEWNNKLDKARAELSTVEEQWLILQEQLAAL
jgi:hypothetical protein